MIRNEYAVTYKGGEMCKDKKNNSGPRRPGKTHSFGY